MSTSATTLKLDGLEALIKALKGKTPVVRIGILGEKTTRNAMPNAKQNPSNAEIGAAHEFGTSTLPERSFLRVPIAEHLQKELEDSGISGEQRLKEVIRSKSIVPWLEQVGIAAEACVSDAFETSGDGKWPKWKNPNYTNGGGQLLVDTNQLRESITSKVVTS